MMDAATQIKLFQDFFDESYKVQILESIRKGDAFLVVDFLDLSKFSPELAEMILDNPLEVVKAAEIAIEHFDLPESMKNYRVRFRNLPDENIVMIRDIRSTHLNKLFHFDGIVRQKSDVRPQVTSARFECPSCGNTINVLQMDTKFKEPSRCSCGRKGKFRLLSKELVDAQGLVLEESPDDLEGGEQPKRMNILLKNDLVSPLSDKKTNPGTKIKVCGILNEVPITLRDGGQSTRFDLIIEANMLESTFEDFYDIKIEKEELDKILELAADPKVYDRLIGSLAPSIYGHDRVKEALLLQLFGGIRKHRDDGVITRGDIHILLIGDPGGGKCLHKDSRIMAADGSIITISDFVESRMCSYNQVDDTGFSCHPVGIYSFNSDAKLVQDFSRVVWRRKSPKKLIKIVTQSGNELLVTKNHPLFCTQNALIHSIEAKDFKKGDFIATPRVIRTNASLQKLDFTIEKSRANNRVGPKIPKYLDENIARFLGYLVGDSWVSYTKTTGVVTFTNNDSELLDDFNSIIKNSFGLSTTIRSSRAGKTAKECSAYSIELLRILEKIEPSLLELSGGKKVPQIINRSPNYVVRDFIRSLFDCEAHIRKDKREIEFSSKSELLVRDLKMLLLRFEITSSVRKMQKYAANTKNRTKRDYYSLKISGENIKHYYQKIGFVSERKNNELKHMVFSESRQNTNVDVVPGVGRMLRLLRIKYGLTQKDLGVSKNTLKHYEIGDRNPSRAALIKIVETLEQKISLGLSDDIFFQAIKKITLSDIFWDKITSIEEIKSESEYVYDLEISHNHNFVSNAVMVHNSQLLKRISIVSPKARFVGGKGVSGAGLTAAVVRDEFIKGWALEAGALVLANKGLCCIDEMDKMGEEDRAAMHEALEQQTVSISKANIQATLRAETTVLAAANPKLGRFDPYEMIAKQINLPPTLINRFDLIFPIRDLPDKDKDERMAKFILRLHQDVKTQETEFSTDFLRKYIAYAKQNIFPRLTDAALEEIKDHYVKLRTQDMKEGEMQAVPISARQLEALVRLSEASARVRLADKVTKRDARRAIDLLTFCLQQVGLDPETGKIDIDRITTGVSTTERSRVVGVREIIADLEGKLGKTIPVEDIIREATERGLKESEVEESIEKLKRSGDIFEPRRGYISRV